VVINTTTEHHFVWLRAQEIHTFASQKRSFHEMSNPKSCVKSIKNSTDVWRSFNSILRLVFSNEEREVRSVHNAVQNQQEKQSHIKKFVICEVEVHEEIPNNYF
jgi:hypothetical protein